MNNTKDLKIKRKIYTHVNFMETPALLNNGGFRESQYRFVFENDKIQLFDLKNDPSEKVNLASEKIELTNLFLNDFTNWFEDASKELKYNRPIILSKIGVTLPVYEASVSKGLKFKEGHAWAHDWIEKWHSTTDSLYWNIDCISPGIYEVEIEYLCKKQDIGSTLTFSIGQETKEFKIKEAFNSSQAKSNDRIPRNGVYEMTEWKELYIGEFNILLGEQFIIMKAKTISNENVAEINRIKIKGKIE